ncbi:hypothetical protein GOV10_00045 [Candidatus Woesearchaeota archaeon]|nr:hypothetical protein [Candidatus Woesearchaeota archaeon]
MPEPLTIERIQNMQSQGLTNNQIIQSLQRDGYKSSQIFEALNQLAIQPTAPGMGQALPGPGAPSTIRPSEVPSAPPQALNNPPARSAPMAMPPAAPPLGPPGAMGGTSDEELIEAIIDEKWNDLLEDINKIIAWKDRTSQQMDAFDQQLKDMKEQFDRLHQAVVGKVGEYDQHILQVGAEVKAMEKVFSKVLPAFTENVAELQRVATTIKSAAAARTAPKKTAKK